MKTILDLPSEAAKLHFLKDKQYHTFELPIYFNFEEVLRYVSDTIGNKPMSECTGTQPITREGINLDIILNKDGKYAVRPLTLVNPYLYYFLVREITEEPNWQLLRKRMLPELTPHINACAIPILAGANEKFHNATTVLNWWRAMEQRSIELALDYRYMFTTDITNCYGSIDPLSICWALSGKDTERETDEGQCFGQTIRSYLALMQQGKNIGIPQGSAVFDFIAELVLRYADVMLEEAIGNDPTLSGTDYQVLRYRDDYRIFCNSKDALERISYKLQQVLERLNFRMNERKTKLSDSVVTDSIKPDKLAHILNMPPIPVLRALRGETSRERKHRQEQTLPELGNLQKQLLYVLQFARQYPNSGQTRTLLSDLDERIREHINDIQQKRQDRSIRITNLVELDIWDDGTPYAQKAANTGSLISKPSKEAWEVYPFGNIRVLISLLTQIAVENVTAVQDALRVSSRLLESITTGKEGKAKKQGEQEKRELIRKMQQRLHGLPNSTYTKIWLQNITLGQDVVSGAQPYNDVVLCQLVSEMVKGNKLPELWDNSWILPELKKDMPYSSICDIELAKKTAPIISPSTSMPYSCSDNPDSKAEDEPY